MNEERKRILKLVEAGKLSANEAITLLEALEDKGNEKTTKAEQTKHIVNEVSTNVQPENKHTKDDQKTHHYKQSSVKSKLTEFIDSAVKKIKDLDLDFNFGNAVEVNHIFQHSDALVQNLDVDVSNGSVEIIPWNENDVRVECKVKVYNLESIEKARESFLDEVVFSIDNHKLIFAVQKKQMKVLAKIYVPRVQYEHVKVRMFNGPISGEDLEVSTFRAKTANGTIKVAKINSIYMELETANGQIDLKDSSSKECEIETINGAIKVDGRYEKLDAQSFSGNIVCYLPGEDCHTIGVKTTAGNIDIDTSITRNIDGELKSTLGGFNCEIPHMNIVKEKNEVVQKYLRFKTTTDHENKLYMFAETKTGSINIKPI
ncbi:DUF4097 family beta strand repeat-containing protein [Litchfieldia salsa]|uniref:DUF4097 and DUF4098 domain-containing protein YvlB n=1 Tax=Litchfieldia salsa TaxID=930152 RepID=A0A1H0WC49_9BACI|nr:DUF4097 domain-containing protein [Litchfieldia salsa]SDP88330.1 DUF4097 and DUF4098 domain-containing protein YvlB [Litchfieldia salsa]